MGFVCVGLHFLIAHFIIVAEFTRYFTKWGEWSQWRIGEFFAGLASTWISAGFLLIIAVSVSQILLQITYGKWRNRVNLELERLKIELGGK